MHLIRKPKLLAAWEFLQFLLAIFGGVLAAANTDSWLAASLLAIPVGFIIAALLLAFDHYLFRATSSFTVLAAVIWLIYFGSSNDIPGVAVAASSLLIIFVGSMYIGTESRAYYAWCKNRSREE